MSKLTLHNSTVSVTAVPDLFLEQYMPSANGEFVKVYLYLLKLSKNPPENLSLSSLADFFSCPENDIVRALKYWEKQGLLSLTCSTGHDTPDDISLLPLHPLPEESRKNLEPLPNSSRQISDESTSSFLSRSRISALKEKEEVKNTLYVAETYLGRTLSATDVETLLYFYDELSFSADLLEYLVEYCVSKGSTSIHYLRKVGLSWHEKGITSVQKAKQETTAWNKNYYAILKAFGIRGRAPVTREIEFMDRWLQEYGFPPELIEEACQRTVTQTGQPSFPYADKILSQWKKQGIQTLSDVKIQDEEYKKGQKQPGKQEHRKPADNRFNNFHQRKYDYSRLEEELLKKN